MYFTLLIFFFAVALNLSSANHFYKLFDELARHEEWTFYPDSIVNHRHARSIEGAPCTVNHANKTGNSTSKQADSCTAYPYTYCNPAGQCVCNSKRAVRLELLPGYTFCLPVQYAIDTQRCLPTEPDICSLAYPGSKCTFQRDVVRRNGADGQPYTRNTKNNNNVVVLSQRQDTSSLVAGNGEWRCQCAVGGTINNCKLFVGMSCTNNASICTGIGRQPDQVPTVECNSTAETDLYATCVCALGTERARDRLRCMARQCPRQGTTSPQPSPCRGSAYECYSPGQPQYVQGSGRFYCSCRDVGVSHSENVDGLCCPIGKLPCADFSACINQTSLCDGVKDCDDCSDEELRICARPLPSDASCSRPGIPLSRSQLLNQHQLLAADPVLGGMTQFLQGPVPPNDVNNNVVERRNNLANSESVSKTTTSRLGVYDGAADDNGNSILSPQMNVPAPQFVQAAAFKEVNPMP